MRRTAILLVAFAPFVLAPLFSFSGSLPLSQKLDVGGRADDVILEDVDGDGWTDLVVQSGRDLRFFRYDKEKGFAPKPDRILSLHATAFLWCFARYPDAKERLVSVLGSRGILRHLPAGDPQDLVVHPNVFDGLRADAKPPAYVQFMRDLDGDGLDDALLFDHEQVLILPQRKGGKPDFRLSQRLDLPIETVLLLGWAPHMKTHESTTIPLLSFGDVNGDKLLDIGYYRDESIGVFYQQKDGRFSAGDPKDLAAKKQKPRSTYLKFEVPPTITDLNGDGLADIAVTYPSKGKVHIFYNRSGRTDFTTPDEILQVAKSWSTGITVSDLDGDGKPEIVMGIVRQLDIVSGIDVFTTKKITLELLTYRLRESSLFTNEPVSSLSFQVPYTFQATRENVSIDLTFRPNFDCDIDGDGRRDLLVEKGVAAFSVYPGVAGTLVADKPGYSIDLSPPANVAVTKLFAADFNRDKKSDLILRYRCVDQQQHDEIEVKMSK